MEIEDRRLPVKSALMNLVQGELFLWNDNLCIKIPDSSQAIADGQRVAVSLSDGALCAISEIEIVERVNGKVVIE